LLSLFRVTSLSSVYSWLKKGSPGSCELRKSNSAES
jgi:hypothetical protein